MSKRRGSRPERGDKKSQTKRRFGAGAMRFAQDVRNELGRVNWPDREQLRQSTAVVLVIVVVLGLYVAAWDFVFQNLIRLVFLP